MDTQFEKTGLWQDTVNTPEAIAATLDRASGFDDVASLLTRPGTKRAVITGNGASYYVAQALWLASMSQRHSPVEVVVAPAGLLARGAFQWRDDDVMLAISSSGRLRDLVEAIEDDTFQVPYALITADPTSTLAKAASVCALVEVPSQQSVTHSQAFCGAIAAALSIWATASDDATLAAAASSAPDACSRAIELTLAWAREQLPEIDSPDAGAVFGSREAWAAALEGALVIKEVARIPCEGVETREGATSVTTSMGPSHLLLTLPTGDNTLLDEAEQICLSRGAQVLRAPGGDLAPPSVVAITTFPAAVAVGAELAKRSGLDVDKPDWTEAYYATARAAPASRTVR